MFRFPFHSNPLAPLTLVAALLLASPGPAQTNDSTSEGNPIVITVRYDPSKTGDERCVVEPEDLWLPKGASQVIWSMGRQGTGAADTRNAPQLESVGFDASVPVTSSGRMRGNRWRATFDRDQALPKTPYDVHLRQSDGEVIECYPHVAGSTDQGGGG